MVSNSNSSSNNSSDDDDESVDRRFLAASSKKGWQGSNLELAHQMESHRDQKVSQHAAVDIRQFQNTQVGKGYQAKHVVRQRQVAGQDTELVVKDMALVATTTTTSTAKSSAGGASSKSKSKSKEKKRRADQDADASCTTTTRGGPKSKLQKYLSSPELILFRGEVEDILYS